MQMIGIKEHFVTPVVRNWGELVLFYAERPAAMDRVAELQSFNLSRKGDTLGRAVGCCSWLQFYPASWHLDAS